MRKIFTKCSLALLFPVFFYSCGDHKHTPLNDGKISTNGIEAVYSISCSKPEVEEVVTFTFNKVSDGNIGVILEVNDNKIEIIDFPYSFNTTFLSEGTYPYSIACGFVSDGVLIDIEVNAKINGIINVEND